MTYATATELLERFDANEIAQRADRGVPRLITPQLMKDVAAGASLVSYTPDEQARAAEALAIVERALQDADDTINGYISARYTLPLQVVPGVLNRVACELARYFLFDDQVTEVIKERYTASVKWLAEVAKGTVSLGADAGTGEQAVSSSSAELETSGRVWRREDSRSFL